ncbi:MAG: anaerobic ribonucleoside-triphosphate reductase activating protein [Clostridium sp.]|uniref:anaerobic ribonucleoside-triphosphate reductase activating protein n=1 Tax=Clostridium sp. TaxID=1506 RepID=UPI003EE42E8A
MIRYMDITHDSVVDGEGLRSVLYTCICYHKCKGCHNPSSWDYKNGKDISIDEAYLELISNPLTNITFSGGDPFEQCEALIRLAKKIKINTNKNIWCYTGYTIEEILKDNNRLELLKFCDVIVDGRYIEEEKDFSLLFKGSKSQRIIDVQKSLKENKIILYETVDK